MRSRLIPILGLLIGGGALLAGLISIAIGEEGPNTVEIVGSSEAQRLFGGLPQQGATLGSESAPVTISLFTDLQCERCAEYHLATVPALVEGLVRPGEARLDLRHFSLGGRAVQSSALAATAAGEQDAQWQYAHLVVGNLDEVGVRGVNAEFLEPVAAAVPGPRFEVLEWRSSFDAAVADAPGSMVRARVEADAALAADLRLPAHPAVVVDGPGGTRELTEAPSLEEIEAAVAAVS